MLRHRSLGRRFLSLVGTPRLRGRQSLHAHGAQHAPPIYFDGANYVAEAYAYGMKTFSLGSGGNVIFTGKFVVNNPNNINVTAEWRGQPQRPFRDYRQQDFQFQQPRDRQCSIPAPTGFSVKHARYIVLSAGPTPGASGDPTMTGANLGGAEIPNDGSSWSGNWTRLAVTNGGVNLSVLPTNCVIVDLQNYPRN